MKHVTIILNEPLGQIYGDVIGVDYGALLCTQKKIPMALACGDFDSVKQSDLKAIEEGAKRFLQLDPIKDITDFSYALSQCDDYDVIHVYGALGRRIDHEMINIIQAFQDPRIILYNQSNRIQSFTEGEYSFKKGEYKYFSIIPFESFTITLEGFKYPLHKVNVNPFEDYLSSNEIIDDATMIIHQGRILCIQSNDESPVL